MLIRALLIKAYRASQSSGLLDRNITFWLVRIRELGVGGDRIDMSSAVPRRRGTNGVNSNANRGCTPHVEGLDRPLAPESASIGRAMLLSKASIKPGVTVTLHS